MKRFVLTKKKRKEWQNDWKEFNRLLRVTHQPKITFEEYVDRRTGVLKLAVPTGKIPSYKIPRLTEYYPSKVTVECNTGKSPTNKYNGNRKLIGIGTLHKSNLVPIFSEDEAEDIANMRRN